MGDPRAQVVIVGAGFGGLRAARSLARAPVDVTVVDRRNYHLFQPLLYQVATAGLEPEEIAHPVRAILRRQRNARFRLAEVLDVDFAAHELHTSAGKIAYDSLILAFGTETDFFGLEAVERHGLALKSLADAVAIRDQVLRQFELVVQEGDAQVRRAMLTFVVVGGGPTGVELAGMLSELIRLVLARDFPELEIQDVRVLLLEATQQLLAGFPKRLQQFTAETLRRKHVEVRFGARVELFDSQRVELAGGASIPTHTVLWAAGARAGPLARRLELRRGRLGRICVDEQLRVPGLDGVFAIGDVAEHSLAQIPMMAQPAIQQGACAARNVVHRLRGEPLEAFRFRDPGQMATIGRNQAVARVGRLELRGFVAWVAWLVVHLIYLIGFRSRLLVLVNWAWDYFLYERAVRLITTDDLDPKRPE
ncbi:MAG: NAD(P)/FAD-dependent oxidoreductase [Myxococcota bacterium]